MNRINGQLVQNLGTSSLTEVLNEGNTASTNIDLSGFNLTDTNEGNVTIGQDLAVHGNIYFDPPQNSDQTIGNQNLSQVLNRGAKTGGTDIDLDGANLTDTAKGNVTIGQDLLTYGAIYGTGADLAEKYPSNQDLEPGEIVRVSADGQGKVVRTEERFSSSIGVVSSNPGLVMDRGQEGHVVGLTGKVPVKVRKTDIDAGDRIVPSRKDGAGTTCRTKDETAAESFEEFKQISKHNRECRSATLGTALEDRSRGETTITALVK